MNQNVIFGNTRFGSVSSVGLSLGFKPKSGPVLVLDLVKNVAFSFLFKQIVLILQL